MCTACVVPVKRLRRTVNFPGTFEGVSAPREFAQPSLLSKHRTPYGSRHFEKPLGFVLGASFFVCIRHKVSFYWRFISLQMSPILHRCTLLFFLLRFTPQN